MGCVSSTLKGRIGPTIITACRRYRAGIVMTYFLSEELRVGG
jgi:hypothetical protein